MLMLSGPGPERRVINACLQQPGRLGVVAAGEFCLVEVRDCVCKGFLEEVSSGWVSKA